MLKTLPPMDEWDCLGQAAKVGGFSLHAGVAVNEKQRDKLERLCRYVTRPPVSEKRQELTVLGQVRYCLKTPYKDGTTHVILEPLDFIARLAALVPKPRVNLIRYHGVLAPNAKHRAEVTSLGRGKGATRDVESQCSSTDRSDGPTTDWADKTLQERHQVMRWAQRLKRVFDIDIEVCVRYGGQMRVIACMEDPVAIIKKIRAHLASFGSGVPLSANKRLPEAWGPPPIQGRLFR